MRRHQRAMNMGRQPQFMLRKHEEEWRQRRPISHNCCALAQRIKELVRIGLSAHININIIMNAERAESAHHRSGQHNITSEHSK